MSTPTPTPKRIYLFDSLRTCSQLLRKIFEPHPDLEQMIHFYAAPGSYGPEALSQHLKHCAAAEEVRQKWLKDYPDRSGMTYEAMNEKVTEFVKEVEASGKVLWGKDHSVSVLRQEILLKVLQEPEWEPSFEKDLRNPLYLPDDLVNSLTPIFLIRHPALAVPSYWKVQAPLQKHEISDEDFRVFSSLRWTKIVFDYFQALGRPAILVDAEDLLANPERLVEELCRRLGIDPRGVKTEWEGFDEGKWPSDDISDRFTGDLLRSRGVEKAERRMQDLDLDSETEKWRASFGVDAAGNDIAAGIRAQVKAELPVYEYLRQFRLQV